MYVSCYMPLNITVGGFIFNFTFYEENLKNTKILLIVLKFAIIKKKNV